MGHGVRKGKVSVGVGGLLGYAKRRSWVQRARAKDFSPLQGWGLEVLRGPSHPSISPFGGLRTGSGRTGGGLPPGGLGDVLEGWGEWSRFPPARE